MHPPPVLKGSRAQPKWRTCPPCPSEAGHYVSTRSVSRAGDLFRTARDHAGENHFHLTKEVFFLFFFQKPLDFSISIITLILNIFSENRERLFLMYSNSFFHNGQTESDVFSDLFSVSSSMHSTAQHSTAQHSTAQHSTAQYSTAQHSTVQYSRKIQTAFA